MGIPVLSDSAICMCPHGGQLQFFSTHFKADGADSQVLTISDYSNAMIVGCTLPAALLPPCLRVMTATDILGQAKKVRGEAVVTPTVISFTDQGWPIIVVYPGRSAISINPVPSIPPFAPSTSFPHEEAAKKKNVRSVLELDYAPQPKRAVPHNEILSKVNVKAPSGLELESPRPRDEVQKLSPSEKALVEGVSRFVPKGITKNEAIDYLKSDEGKEMLKQLRTADPTSDAKTIFVRAVQQLRTCTKPPKMIRVPKDSALVKIVPKGATLKPHSPYFTTKEQLEAARMSKRPLSDVFGLPADSDAAEYEMHEIAAKEGAVMFVADIAPTEELDGKFKTKGGAIQTIVPNRRQFGASKVVSTISDN